MEKYLELNNRVNIPVDGSIQLGKDKEAARAYFLDHVNQNTVYFQSLSEKINYLITNDYIDPEVTVEQYSFEFIKSLFTYIYGKKFRFDSFMGAYKFFKQYAMKNSEGNRYLERYEDRVAFNALFMGNGNEVLAMNIAEELIERRYQPATPTFLNAGRKNRGEFVSCFLLQVEDDMNSIGRAINSSLQLSKLGGGVGLNLSDLREASAPIKNIQGAASGVVPVMKLLEDSFKYANQLGQRSGAGAVYLNVFHMDVLDFLSTRVENAEESKRIKMLSLGLVVPDKYYELVENGEVIHLFSAYDATKEYGMPFSFIDITKEYENMVANPNIRKRTIKSSELSDAIGKLQQESGYPYILNVDNVNKVNPIDGKVIMSNLCSEILQVQTPSEIDDEQNYTKLGKDVSCNLGSINIPNFMESKNADTAEKSIETMTRALTFISDESDIKVVPSVRYGNASSHSIGLGAMGLHTYLATNLIEYGSRESIEFVDKFFEMVNFFTIKASNKIATERKESFLGFEKSDYATGAYFDKYTNTSDDELTPKVKELFAGFPLPQREDWVNLRKQVMETGLYNQNRLAVAPNGSISYVNETSASLHPITALVEKRQEKKIGSIFYPAPKLNNENMKFYKSAYDTSMLKVIDLYAAAQRHIDQGMSLTLFMRSEIPEGLYPWKPEGGPMTTKDLTLIRHYAWKKGIKTIYYIRTFTADEDEIGVNECESCSI